MPLVQAMQSGFTMGRQAAGAGRLSGLGVALKGIADRLKETRVAEQESQSGLLGKIQTEQIKSLFREKKPSKYGEEARGFERFKAEIKPKKRTAIERKAIAKIRKLKQINAPVKDMHTWLKFEGLEPADYANEIGNYQPKIELPKKSFLKKIFD